MLRLTDGVRNAMLDTFIAFIDAGSPANPGKIKIYSGSRPVDVDSAAGVGNTLLATPRFGTTSFTAAGSAGGNSPGQSAANAITAATGIVGGLTAAWFAFTDGNDNKACDGTIKQTGAVTTADAEIDQVLFVNGGTLRVTSLILRIPDA